MRHNFVFVFLIGLYCTLGAYGGPTVLPSGLVVSGNVYVIGAIYAGDTNNAGAAPGLFLWNGPQGALDSLGSDGEGLRYRGMPTVDLGGNIYLERLSNALASVGVEVGGVTGWKFDVAVLAGGGDNDGYLNLWNAAEGRFEGLSFRDDGMFWSSQLVERHIFTSEGRITSAALEGATTNLMKYIRVGGPLLGGNDNYIAMWSDDLNGYQGWVSQDNGLAFRKADESAVDFMDPEGNVYQGVVTNALREMLATTVPASNSAPGYTGLRASQYTNGQFYTYEWWPNARGTNTPGWIRTPPGTTNW